MDMPLTDFDFVPAETDKSDKTDWVSNQEFMLAVFGESTSDYRPLIVSFAGNPAQVHKSAWFGKPWVSNEVTAFRLPATANNYLALYES